MKLLNIKRLLVFIFALAAVTVNAQGQFQDKTLRLDYIFSGTDKTWEIALDEISVFEGWAGRRENLDSLALRGNCILTLSSESTGKVIYKQSYSTLFQEWQATEEATKVRKSFENVFLAPMPVERAVAEVIMFDVRGNVVASLKHLVNPSDILIRQKPRTSVEAKYILQSGSPETCIDVAILAEGYNAEEKEVFYEDARKAVESILSHSPFDKYENKFNFLAVALESDSSGVSVPGQGIWKETALSSNFDTFYSERYLTTLRQKAMHNLLSGLPYEHIIILANTDTYGGGGIYNLYTITTAHHQAFEPVVVHEFGHSFAGLGDEYYYDDMYVEYYYSDIEPWEQNITTLVDFGSKWQDMVEAGTAELIEGGGYQSKGVYRGAHDCRMKTNTASAFCPVCQRAIDRIIQFYL